MMPLPLLAERLNYYVLYKIRIYILNIKNPPTPLGEGDNAKHLLP
jgi:hypothetical protein